MPRRHQLRGPFGQMLMEEMAKSDLKQQVVKVSQDVLFMVVFRRPEMVRALRASAWEVLLSL